MYFSDFHNSLVNSLRDRVRNGQLTERSLAKLVGVSQPHIHNVLKGVRLLSPELGDQILRHLRLTLLDLVDRNRLETYLNHNDKSMAKYIYYPVLKGLLGPGHPWPEEVCSQERFPVPSYQTAAVSNPVVARLSADPRMNPLFGDGDFVLLDQSQRARTEINANSYYVVRRGVSGFIRRARISGRYLYLLTEDSIHSPNAWEQISLEYQQVQHIIRARATLIAREKDWSF